MTNAVLAGGVMVFLTTVFVLIPCAFAVRLWRYLGR